MEMITFDGDGGNEEQMLVCRRGMLMEMKEMRSRRCCGSGECYFSYNMYLFLNSIFQIREKSF